MENDILTVEQHLNGIKQIREQLLARKTEVEQARDNAAQELVTIARELERIDVILANGTGQPPKERSEKVSSFVLEQVQALLTPGVAWKEKDFIEVCRKERFDLSDSSIQGALRRLAEKQLILRSGPRRDREIALIPTESEAAE